MVTTCPVCGHDLFFDPHQDLLRCPKGHGHFPWTCSECRKNLDVVSVKQYGGVAIIAPYLNYLQCPDGHGGTQRWSENWCILWERYEADRYYYFYVKDRGGNGDRFMPFSQGISLNGPDDTPCYVRGDSVSGSRAATNALFREMASFGPVPRTPANEAAINYIVMEMGKLGFEDVWHAKADPWYTYYFYSEYPRNPRPPDWHQRMEQVRSFSAGENKMASEMEMRDALNELLQSSYSPDAMGQVLERKSTLMLNPAFLDYSRRLKIEAGMARNSHVEWVEQFLKNAIEHGVTYALNQEKRTGGQKKRTTGGLLEIANTFLGMDAHSAPAYVRQHQSSLVTEEGIAMVQAIIETLEEDKHIPLPQTAKDLALATFKLKLRFLEEAQALEINEASRRYWQRLQQLMR